MLRAQRAPIKRGGARESRGFWGGGAKRGKNHAIGAGLMHSFVIMKPERNCGWNKWNGKSLSLFRVRSRPIVPVQSARHPSYVPQTDLHFRSYAAHRYVHARVTCWPLCIPTRQITCHISARFPTECIQHPHACAHRYACIAARRWCTRKALCYYYKSSEKLFSEKQEIFFACVAAVYLCNYARHLIHV